MENDCKVRKSFYSTMSQYTKNIGKGFQLGHEYMRLSREALMEDEMEIKMRRFSLEGKVKKWQKE